MAYYLMCKILRVGIWSTNESVLEKKWPWLKTTYPLSLSSYCGILVGRAAGQLIDRPESRIPLTCCLGDWSRWHWRSAARTCMHTWTHDSVWFVLVRKIVFVDCHSRGWTVCVIELYQVLHRSSENETRTSLFQYYQRGGQKLVLHTWATVKYQIDSRI